MYNLSLSKIAEAIEAKLIGEGERVEPRGASIDTRKLKPGDLFFALAGEKTDGHHYLAEAYRLGAVAAVVNRIPPELQRMDFPLLLVPEPEKALQRLALVQRNLAQVPVIAVTGSTGKTTTKDILASILAVKGNVLSTRGNYNNELGLPLTLLALEKQHWAVVTEMGMDALGEIDFLASIARPTHGVITNIGRAHQEILGSQEKIAQAKAELFPHISPEGGLVLNKQDEVKLRPWLPNVRCRISWIDYLPPADLWVTEIRPNEHNHGHTFEVCAEGRRIPLTLNIPGRHNIINSLAAVSIARQLGLSWEEIKLGLSMVHLTPMRLEIIQLPEQKLTLINDAYNASPDSMASALEVLQSVAGKRRKIAVLGDMFELGSYSVKGHFEVGEKAKAIQPEYLITVGELGRFIAEGAIKAGFPQSKTRSFRENQEALLFLKSIVTAGDVILVKGSRGVQMEQIVAGLCPIGP
ncbi:MAG: UDP-N-acetylmuramoyl-tripeptide--D-alanyl-D-alanine ligase [Clostridia bacterium]|nr:UDP-N-acetylmuramoyl-tripeptide--D-alanyl-D-alanine ligase [Clostridia bacterium]